jgi:predicted outer membrane repeat protein
MVAMPRMLVRLLKPIPAAVVVLFGLVPLPATGVQLVANCDDSGDGSLRKAILDATEGEEVDASQLQCSKISLSSGPLIVAKNSLMISGPGSALLAIERANVFLHGGEGTLSIANVAIRNGYAFLDDASKYLGGGCISSSGDVVLDHATVTNCTMKTGNLSRSRGGAVFAEGNVTLLNSTVSGNDTVGAEYGNYYYRPTFGGAIFAKGHVLVSHSVVSGNHATYGGGIFSKGGITLTDSSVTGNNAYKGGAVHNSGDASISGSTISGNHARFTGGGLFLQATTNMAPESATISNSTISGNSASEAFYASSAVLAYLPLTISSSTIAFNSSPVGSKSSAVYGFGTSLGLHGSIVAENQPADILVQPATTVSGTGNLLTTPFDAMPGDTIVACPQLERLADNGGPTLTHELRLTSPAIDSAGTVTPTTDQRGAGFVRPYGAYADIGALEWQGTPIDAVFASGFQDTALFCDL